MQAREGPSKIHSILILDGSQFERTTTFVCWFSVTTVLSPVRKTQLKIEYAES
jgi:hypothetical protein